MKLEKYLKNKKVNEFVKRCMLDDFSGKAKINKAWFLSCLEKAKDLDDLERMYFQTDNINIICSQAYGVFSQRTADHDLRLEKLFNHANNTFTTYSDVGSLKIGVGDSSVLIPNGCGDGKTTVGFFDANNPFNEALDHMMMFFTTINGEFDLYEYDCGDEVAMKIKGKYFVFYANSYIAFQNINNNN